MSSLADVERVDVHFDEPCGKQVHAVVQQNSALYYAVHQLGTQRLQVQEVSVI